MASNVEHRRPKWDIIPSGNSHIARTLPDEHIYHLCDEYHTFCGMTITQGAHGLRATTWPSIEADHAVEEPCPDWTAQDLAHYDADPNCCGNCLDALRKRLDDNA